MERESFLKFRNRFARYSKMDMVQISIYAPIFYSFEDKYYNACSDYLDSGEEKNVSFLSYSTDLIMETMYCSYLEALVILRNIENNPDSASLIYRPRIVE